MNNSGIKPVEYLVLVEPKEIEDTTSGGLIIPDEVKEKDGFSRQEGVLVALSPMAFVNPDWPEKCEKPQAGDRVIFAKYNATQIRGNDGKDYWIMKDTAVMAVMEQKNE